MANVGAWWATWLAQNAPDALSAPGTLSDDELAIDKKARALVDMHKVVERYHASGTREGAKMIVAEAKIMADAYDARLKLLSNLASVSGRISQEQIKANQRNKAELLRAEAALTAKAAQGDLASVAKVRSVYSLNGKDAALAQMAPLLGETSTYVTDGDHHSLALPATFSNSLTSLGVDANGLYDLDTEGYAQRMQAAGFSQVAIDSSIPVFEASKQANEQLRLTKEDIQRATSIADRAIPTGASAASIERSALKAADDAKTLLQMQLTSTFLDPQTVTIREQEAREMLVGYQMAVDLTKKLTEQVMGAEAGATRKEQLAASPAFQAWAREHGFPNVGTTDADGNFTPGFDDYDATAEFIRQAQRKRPPMIGRHAPKESYVKIKVPNTPEKQAAVEAEYGIADAEGKTVYVRDKETGAYLSASAVKARTEPAIMEMIKKDEDTGAEVTYVFNEDGKSAIAYETAEGQIVNARTVPREEVPEGTAKPLNALEIDASGEEFAVRPVTGRIAPEDDAQAREFLSSLGAKVPAFGSREFLLRTAVEYGLKAKPDEAPPLNFDREIRRGFRAQATSSKPGEEFTQPGVNDGYVYKVDADSTARYKRNDGDWVVAEGGAADSIRRLADEVQGQPTAADAADPLALDPLNPLDPVSTDPNLEIVTDPPAEIEVVGVRIPAPANRALLAKDGEFYFKTDEGVTVANEAQVVDRIKPDNILGIATTDGAKRMFGETVNYDQAIRFSPRNPAIRERRQAAAAEAQEARVTERMERRSPAAVAAAAPPTPIFDGQTLAEGIAASREANAPAVEPKGGGYEGLRAERIQDRAADQAALVEGMKRQEQAKAVGEAKIGVRPAAIQRAEERLQRLESKADALKSPQYMPAGVEVGPVDPAPPKDTTAEVSAGVAAKTRLDAIRKFVGKDEDRKVSALDRLRFYLGAPQMATRQKQIDEKQAEDATRSFDDTLDKVRRPIASPGVERGQKVKALRDAPGIGYGEGAEARAEMRREALVAPGARRVPVDRTKPVRELPSEREPEDVMGDLKGAGAKPTGRTAPAAPPKPGERQTVGGRQEMQGVEIDPSTFDVDLLDMGAAVRKPAATKPTSLMDKLMRRNAGDAIPSPSAVRVGRA